MIILALVLLLLSLTSVWGVCLRVADRRSERRALRSGRARRARVAER
jgi:hypothetical protein